MNVPVIMNNKQRRRLCAVRLEDIGVGVIRFSLPGSLALLALRILAVQAEVFRDCDDRMPRTEVREIKHDRNGNTEGHLLFDGKLAPLIFAYSVAPVDHYCIVRTNCSALDETLR